MQKKHLHRFLERLIERLNGIHDLPDLNSIESEIKELNITIRDEIKSCTNSDLENNFSKFLTLYKQLVLRKRINSGVALLIYFIYTIAGSFVGIGFLIGIFFTTQGFIGHILVLVSLLGSIISILIGIWSINKQMDLTKELIR